MAATEKSENSKCLEIKGRIQLESVEGIPDDVKLSTYVFNQQGELIGEAPVDNKGKFDAELKIKKPQTVEVVVAKANDAPSARKSSLSGRGYSASDWVGRVLKPAFYITKVVWWPWWPKRICISGSVRRESGNCAVPFVKVEVFDVDRLFCLLPYLTESKPERELSRVIKIEDLVKASRGSYKELSRPVFKPDPPDLHIGEVVEFLPDLGLLNPQPEPPGEPFVASNNVTAIAEAERVNSDLVENIKGISFTSKRAPWVLFPKCFYSQDLICTTNTDENGDFNCCIDWWPLQFRRGWFNLDWRPDIVIRVTQNINGVEKVLYIDPVSNIRWNVTNAQIEVVVDDDELECGGGSQTRPEGTDTFFTRIGNDEVYLINQASGLYENPPWSNVAYGKSLRVHAQFGDLLSRTVSTPKSDSQLPYYFRLSYSQNESNFTPITTRLTDTRVQKETLISSSYSLGPQTIEGQMALYEIRDFQNYYWYNPDWIANWVTAHKPINADWVKDVPDGTYTLRLEVFNSAGKMLSADDVNYRDGTVPPESILPLKYPCDLRITVDNNPPEMDMSISPAPTGCGVVQSSDVPPLDVTVRVDQANSHLYYWALQYIRGDSSARLLESDYDRQGLATPVNKLVDAMPMLEGVTATCAFSLKLRAWSNIRNGYGLIWYSELINAITVEDCSEK